MLAQVTELDIVTGSWSYVLGAGDTELSLCCVVSFSNPVIFHMSVSLHVAKRVMSVLLPSSLCSCKCPKICVGAGEH